MRAAPLDMYGRASLRSYEEGFEAYQIVQTSQSSRGSKQTASDHAVSGPVDNSRVQAKKEFPYHFGGGPLATRSAKLFMQGRP